MDEKLRKLERQAITGNEQARHRLFVEHIRLGILKPVDPGIAEYKKQQAQEAAKKLDLRERTRGNKRMTPEQRKQVRRLRKSSGTSVWPRRRTLKRWLERGQ